MRLQPDSVAVVVVTYGNRLCYLCRAIAAAVENGVGKVFVVDNGSGISLADLRRSSGTTPVAVTPLQSNMGSAAAIGAGLRLAVSEGWDAVLLLDDDNELESGSLLRLVDAYNSAAQASTVVAVSATREGHGFDRVLLSVNGQETRAQDSAFSFHVGDIFSKIIRKAGLRKLVRPATLPEVLDIPSAPYGGLLIGRQTIDLVGVPDVRLVLYQDDTDYTERIVRAGGRVVLVTGAKVRDLEDSWNSAPQHTSSFSQFLLRGSDLRVFYTFRNRAYLDRRRAGRGSMIYLINVSAYLIALTVVGLACGKIRRLVLLLQAFILASTGRLGLDPRFPLYERREVGESRCQL